MHFKLLKNDPKKTSKCGKPQKLARHLKRMAYSILCLAESLTCVDVWPPLSIPYLLCELFVFACCFSSYGFHSCPLSHFLYYRKSLLQFFSVANLHITRMLINLDSEKLCIFTPLTNKFLRLRNVIHPSLTYMLLLAYILIPFLKAHET